MCRIHSQGTQHGCGHYIITKEVSKRDCGNRFCMNSEQHPPNCAHCPDCKRYLDPDFQETVTRKTTDFCSHCEYWFKNKGGAVRQER